MFLAAFSSRSSAKPQDVQIWVRTDKLFCIRVLQPPVDHHICLRHNLHPNDPHEGTETASPLAHLWNLIENGEF